MLMESQQKIKQINIKDLHLWTENPRDPVNCNLSDEEIIKRAESDTDNKWNLKKLVDKMGEYYDYSELPTVVYENQKYVVYDGNRRIAVLKCLQDKNKYSTFIGKLFPNIEPEELRNQKSIPCNLCDKQTALNNIERKHVDNSSWGQIERDYFSHYHRNKEKSLFLILDEQTKLISNNSLLNKRFVKEEVLTEKNLKQVGIFLKDGKIKSNYSESQIVEIFEGIMKLIKNKVVSTRSRRKELKKPLLESFKELKPLLNKVSDKNLKLVTFNNTDIEAIKDKIIKKTPLTKKTDNLFGRTLKLQKGPINDFYCAIDYIDKKTKNNENSLLIIGVSLRLIIDLSARIYYKSIGDIETSEKDQIYKDFLKLAKQQLSKEQVNFLSLTNDWLSGSYNLDGLLGKYAHANIVPNRSDILKMSCVVADILEYFFKDKN